MGIWTWLDGDGRSSDPISASSSIRESAAICARTPGPTSAAAVTGTASPSPMQRHRPGAGADRRFGTCVPVIEVNGKIRQRGRFSEVLFRRLIDAPEVVVNPLRKP